MSGQQVYLNAIFCQSKHDQSDCKSSHQEESNSIFESLNVGKL